MELTFYTIVKNATVTGDKIYGTDRVIQDDSKLSRSQGHPTRTTIMLHARALRDAQHNDERSGRTMVNSASWSTAIY